MDFLLEDGFNSDASSVTSSDYIEEEHEDEEEDEEEEEEEDDSDESIDIELPSNIPVMVNKKKTFPYMTSFERVMILGLRTQQLKNGSAMLVNTTCGDHYQIAKMEFEKGILPFKIRRNFPDGTFEIWELKDFTSLTI